MSNELNKDEFDCESVSLVDSSLIFWSQTDDVGSESDKTSDRASDSSALCWSQADEEDSELEDSELEEASDILSDPSPLY